MLAYDRASSDPGIVSIAPGGSYAWAAILARTGTNPAQSANWVGVDVAPFTFTP